MRRNRLLLVDDYELNIEVLEGFLAGMDYEILRAFSGQEALALMEKTVPDLVILDVVMPEMDGYEVCRRIKGNPRWSFIPVIMVTALEEKIHRITGIEAGADEFLTKPVDRLELITRVKALLKTRELRGELEKNYNNLKYQLSLARSIQKSLMPENSLTWENIRINTLFLPQDDVGGDIVDIRDLGNGRLSVLLADSVGHGVPAALVAVMIKSIFSNVDFAASPQTMMEEINTKLCKAFGYNMDGLYATGILIILDRQDRKVWFVNAGHPPAVLLDRDGVCSMVEMAGTPLGFSSEGKFEVKSFRMDQVSGITLYTDGLLALRQDQEGCKILAFLQELGETADIEAHLKELRERIDYRYQDDITLVRISC